jgi:hypothetical protein
MRERNLEQQRCVNKRKTWRCCVDCTCCSNTSSAIPVSTVRTPPPSPHFSPQFFACFLTVRSPVVGGAWSRTEVRSEDMGVAYCQDWSRTEVRSEEMGGCVLSRPHFPPQYLPDFCAARGSPPPAATRRQLQLHTTSLESACTAFLFTGLATQTALALAAH